jgi:polyphosphate kinase
MMSRSPSAGEKQAAGKKVSAEATAGKTRRRGAPTAASPSIDLDSPDYYVNRELSLLAFQRRVLEEARDTRNPLLERVKFLAIVGSNLDEFFMVRVAGLKQQIEAGVLEPGPDGMSPAQQLAAVRRAAAALVDDCYTCFREELKPALRDAGIVILDHGELTKRQRMVVKKHFDEVVFPVLTPLALDPGRPFPHISNLSLNLAVLVKDAAGERRFARVKVPDTLPRLVPIKRSSGGVRKDGTTPLVHYFVWLEQVIAANIDTLFPGMRVVEAHPFRVTRSADVIIQELEADDLLESTEETLRQRRFGTVTRLSVNPGVPAEIRAILLDNLDIDRKDAYKIGRAHV